MVKLERSVGRSVPIFFQTFYIVCPVSTKECSMVIKFDNQLGLSRLVKFVLVKKRKYLARIARF